MAGAGSERLLRYMLLLGEGGQLVFRDVIQREVGKRAQPLGDILASNKDILSSTIKDEQMLKKIFPSQNSINADTTRWDIALLGLVLIHVFGSDLSKSEIKYVKEIFESRIRLAGAVSTVTLRKSDYRKMRLYLSMSLLKLASGVDFNTHYDCLEIVSTSGAKPLGLHATLQHLSSLHEFANDTLNNICAKLEIDMQVLDGSSERDSAFLRHMSGVQRKSLSRISGEKPGDLHVESWYYGTLSREETHELFENVKTDGVYLLRDCLSTPGDFVLCVKQGSRISQYVISRLQTDGNIMFRIGEKDFEDIPALLEFYRTHYLDKTPLTEPAPRKKFLAKYDFNGNDSKDLSFKKGEILEMISKEDDSWWYAKNKDGNIGLVPKLHLTSLKDANNTVDHPGTSPAELKEAEKTSRPDSPTPPVPKRLPSKAVVTKTRISSPYDVSQLSIHEGDIVNVTKIIGDGHCEGECKGKTGLFPSRYVTFLDDL